jgi:NAD(P)H-hydrate epimerase
VTIVGLILTRDQIRSLDEVAIRDFGVPGIVLMENAGRGAADVLTSLGIDGQVVVWCGKGNNGGDGFVLARHLAIRGVKVLVRLFGQPEELHGDAAIAWRMLTACDHVARVAEPLALPLFELQQELRKADWVVDGLFGTGFQGPVRPPWDQVIGLMNNSAKRILALDLPSGLDADTGQPGGLAVRATATVTFAAFKPGLLAEEARPYVGALHFAGIGVDPDRVIHGWE